MSRSVSRCNLLCAVRTVDFASTVFRATLFVAGDLSSELGTDMTFLSAYEDFMLRTLARVEGAFEKLSYLVSLRRPGGAYSHWGMSRTYGSTQASEAIGHAHTQVWLEVLRKPLPALLAESQGVFLGMDRTGQAQASRQEIQMLMPADLGGGSKRHFSSILLTLSLLAQTPKESNRSAA